MSLPPSPEPPVQPVPAPQDDLDVHAAEVAPVLQALRSRGLRLATAESCTGGLIAAAFTAVAGSSDVFDRGFVTYSNAAKTELLGVPATLVEAHGAVSEPVARAMAAGALARSAAHLAISVTGVAGPGGGTSAKPVGLVWMALAWRAHADPAAPTDLMAWRLQFGGPRSAVRSATVRTAIQRIADAARS